MTSTIHILAACTERKRILVPERLQLRTVSATDTVGRAKSWWHRLQKHRGQSVRASELYAGGHWSVIRALPDVARQQGFNSKEWVISAGYGLSSTNDNLHPYSATFTGSHPDSVTNQLTDKLPRKTVLQKWWNTLSALQEERRAKPLSIQTLARKSPKAIFVIIASPDYLLAMEEDILSALQLLETPNQILIISSPSEALSSTLNNHLIPSVAQLQPVVGGALCSLHARVALMIFQHASKWELRADLLRRKFKKIAASNSVLMRYDRVRVTDAKVTIFIRERLKRVPHLSCTSLLTELRENGIACEQNRFKELYWAEREENYAS